jgi:hypothetical protein
VERKIFVRQRLLAFLSIVTLAIGCLVNEMCAGDDYRETTDTMYQAFLDDPSRAPRGCGNGIVSPLKLAQSALTVCLLVMIVARFRCFSPPLSPSLSQRECARVRARHVAVAGMRVWMGVTGGVWRWCCWGGGGGGCGGVCERGQAADASDGRDTAAQGSCRVVAEKERRVLDWSGGEWRHGSEATGRAARVLCAHNALF